MARKLTGTLFTQTFLFLFLKLLVFSSAKQFGCHLTRWEAGDRIYFFDANQYGTCNDKINPCQRINGSKWKFSTNGCRCRCLKSKSNYREDKGHCVENKLNREGCSLQFIREKPSDPLTVFNNSSSIRFKPQSLPVESCEATRTYFRTDQITQPWKQLQSHRSAFYVRHENRRTGRHAHFLEWTNAQPVDELFGKTVKVQIECAHTNQDDKREQLCIVFKVNGSHDISCPVAESVPPSPTKQTSLVSKSKTLPSTTQIPNTKVPSKEASQGPFTEDVTATKRPERDRTTDSSNIDNVDSELIVGQKVALPIWLIGVITGAAVITTLALTAIIWMCCKMKRRSRRRKKRSQLARNPICNNDDSVASRVCEAGYARVGSPGRKGYAALKLAQGSTRSDYQRLLKPEQDHSGYLLPMEERGPKVTPLREDLSIVEPANIYSEAQSPPPPQSKPKDKEYDYAKPDDFIRVSCSSLQNLDFHANNDPPFVGYKHEQNDCEDNGSSSPLYATVEGPSSPGVSSLEGPAEVSIEDAPVKNGPDGTIPYYIELVPNTDSEHGSALTKNNSEA